MSDTMPSQFPLPADALADDPPVRQRRREQLERLSLWLALVCISVLFLFPVWTERGAIIAREEDRLSEQAVLIDSGLTRSLGGINRALEGVREEIPFFASRSDGWSLASRRMKAFVDAMPGINGMFILDGAGTALAIGTIDSVRVPHPRGNFANKAYFQAVLPHPDPDVLYVSPPFVTDVGVWTFTLARAVVTPTGAFDGLVVATIDLNDYQLWLGSSRYVQDQFATIVHGRGVQIVSEPPDNGEPGRNVATPGLFFSRHIAAGASSSLIHGSTPNAAGEFLIAARTVQPDKLHMSDALVVGVGRELSAVLAPWHFMLRGRLLMLGLFWFVSLASLWTWQGSRRRVRARALAQRRLIEHFFESPLSLLAILKADGRCVRLSAAWQHTMGWDVRALRGQTLHGYVHPDDDTAMEQARVAMEKMGKVDRYFCRLRDTTGQYHEFQIQGVLRDGLQYIDARDVTQERQAQRALQDLNFQLLDKEQELLQLAQRDGLTQLANRRAFDEQLQLEWRRCLREQLPLSVLLIDIDQFKRYNDHYGHLAGDTCLKAVAGAMARCIHRPFDLLARYGGEEFVVLLPSTPADGAEAMAQELRRVVQDLSIVHAMAETAPCVTISVGIKTLVPDETQTLTAFIHAADMALYQAKLRGRNCAVSANYLQADAA